jgi:aminopeptidase N
MPSTARVLLTLMAALAPLCSTLPHARASDQPSPPTPATAPMLAETLAIDRATGRSLANRPPDPAFDHRHMRLEVDIPDLNKPSLTGRQTLDLSPIGRPRDQVILDARSTLTIHAVRVDGKPAEFTHDGRRLRVILNPPGQPGQPIRLETDFTANNPGLDGNGLLMLPAEPGKPGRDQPVIYSQGQSEWNSLWFPCHDFPNLRTTTELIVTVEDGFTVISNGKLISQTAVPPAKPDEPARRRWHWRQDQPHPYYLVSMVVGRFDTIELGGPTSARPNLPMPVYGPLGSADRLRDAFAETPAMVAFFEQQLDEPYPWDQYAQVLVRDFRWGGMENTSASTLTDRTLGRSRDDRDDLIAHELAHQWMGDLITCRSWEHLWLNEGWASFMEAVWAEHRHGPDAYSSRIDSAAIKLLDGEDRSPDDNVPMVSPLYVSPDDPFVKTNDPYARGMLVLHMLRRQLGDQAFWAGTRAYINRHRFNQVETSDFRRELEDASGNSLEGFFTQWCDRPGSPRLAIDFEWAADPSGTGGVLSVLVEQTQAISPARPAFNLRFPLVLTLPDGRDQTLWLTTDQRVQQQQFRLSARPSQLAVNLEWDVLAEITIRRDLDPEPAPPAANQSSPPSELAPSRFAPEQAERERLMNRPRAKP